ncbi:MAG: hypothetical protein KJ622_08610 [Alphaproteobacteria bacterium]|nr:hypothetical protein [Alphaproteobacteria bacterium]
MGIAAKLPHADASAAMHAAAEIFAFVPMLFVQLAKASSAAHAADRLYHMSEAELAARGLSRETLGKHICDTYFAD